MKTKITDELIKRCQADVHLRLNGHGDKTCNACMYTEYECLECILEQLELEKEEEE